MLATVVMISAFMRKSAGSTPTTSNVLPSLAGHTPFIVIFRPTIAGSAAKARCQNAWLRITTGARPGRSSSGTSNRPCNGLAPSRWKSDDDVASTSTRWA